MVQKLVYRLHVAWEHQPINNQIFLRSQQVNHGSNCFHWSISFPLAKFPFSRKTAINNARNEQNQHQKAVSLLKSKLQYSCFFPNTTLASSQIHKKLNHNACENTILNIFYTACKQDAQFLTQQKNSNQQRTQWAERTAKSASFAQAETSVVFFALTAYFSDKSICKRPNRNACGNLPILIHSPVRANIRRST